MNAKAAIVVVPVLLFTGCLCEVAAEDQLHKSVSKTEYSKLPASNTLSSSSGVEEDVLQLCGQEDKRVKADSFEKERIVKITAFFGSAQRSGTGFLVSDTAVVTAGHNIFSYPRKAFASSVKVQIKGTYYNAKEMFTVQGYISCENPECDYGAIQLEPSVTGSSVMHYGDDNERGEVRVAGFPKPNTKKSGEAIASRTAKGGLVAGNGTVKQRDGGILLVDNVQTSDGQSGSPVCRTRTAGRAAIAIYTGGTCENDKPVGKSVRIEGSVKDNINKWKSGSN